MARFEQLQENLSTRVAAATLIASIALTGCSRSVEHEMLSPDATEEVVETEAAAETDVLCAESWELTDYTNERGESPRWFPEGLQAIKDANNLSGEEATEAAREATNEWIDQVKRDPKLLAPVLAVFSNAPEMEAAKGVTIEDLTDSEDPNCASEQAVLLVNQLTVFLNGSADIQASAANPNAVNTGADANGNVVQSEGVAGTEEDRAALEFTYVNEQGNTCTVWVLGRCGQIVTFEDCMPDNIPEGKTDDGELPETPYDAPAEDDPGTPDVAGEGPAGQTPNEDGSLDYENTPEGGATPTPTPTPSPSEAGGGSGTPEDPYVTPDDEQPVAEESEAPTANETDGEDNDGDGQVDEQDESSQGGSDPNPSERPSEPEDPFGN